ncbi:MAG: hypothetical protein IKO19_05245 [Candidatus Riflebacteria bacterium]|nr:hypothetical protein [Candidatus Riflebacteria bacterium]
MRNFRSYAVLLAALTIFSPSFTNKSPVFAQEGTTVSEEAKMLYDDAIGLKKKGKLKEAINSYVKALRKDRTILAFDDDGLIEASYKDSVAKLEESPEDVKLLEVCGFLASVGYSDNKTAITYYEKIVQLVDDEGVKERTNNLIERLRSVAEAQSAYDSTMAEEQRDERVKTWAEMEKIDDFAEESSKATARAEKLNDAYSERESLQNKIPQLEDELKELQESYDKADRLWYTLKDELYERRRRRLKNDLLAKKEEISSAKSQLSSIERTVAKLEKEDEAAKDKEKKSAFNLNRDLENSDSEETEDEDSAFNSNPSDDSSDESEKLDDSDGAETSDEERNESDEEDEYSEEALSRQADEMSEDERKEQLNDLIDNL